MLRFRPDGWLEGLLRPLIMADPRAGIYFEETAPDWRFALFTGFLAVLLLTRRLRGLSTGAVRLLLAMPVLLYLWTFTIGNGRYFMTGLLLIGPLLVLVWRRLPLQPVARWLLLAGVVLLQAAVIEQDYMRNRWGLVHWVQGDGIGLEASPVREQPAVFVTTTGISFSLLVPKFHPASRWANLVGQQDIMPAMREYPRMLELLRGTLPKYLVAPVHAGDGVAGGQPSVNWLRVLGGNLARYGLSFKPSAACVTLRSNLLKGSRDIGNQNSGTLSFWICPLDYDDAARLAALAMPSKGHALADVFESIEAACPRYFPAGNGIDRVADGLVMRQYPASDTRLFIDEAAGLVALKYFRAINPTRIGTVEQVRSGGFQLPCDKLPGRYRLPWQAD